MDMKAKVSTLDKRLEELEMRKLHEVQAVTEIPVPNKLCFICQSIEHLGEQCPTIIAMWEMFVELMSAQNTHHITSCEHILDSFNLVISVVIITYLILGMSRPRSRSDPIGESEPVSGCETIYWDSLFFFIFIFYFL